MVSRGIVTELIRYFYHHERPFSFYNFTPLIPEVGWSFPSGHAAWFFALATVIWYVNRKWGVWYFVLSVVMGIARIYVGVHWPLDVLGGIVAVGVSGVCFLFLFFVNGDQSALIQENFFSLRARVFVYVKTNPAIAPGRTLFIESSVAQLRADP